jgi:NTP pyrophosphatase (non-canonical NTP hydrolase)
MKNKELTLNQYQEQAMSTCMDSCNNYSYMMDNLAAEVGEFAGKIAKAKRKGMIRFTEDGNIDFVTDVTIGEALDFHSELMKEAGDILWQLSGLCHVFGWSLADVGQGNLDKLASRQQRGVIDGNGDNR